MEFNKELVEKNYFLLGNNSTSQEDRQKANKYLMAFQQSAQAFDISFLLLENSNPELQFIAAHLIYQKIKDNLESLLKDKNIFIKYRELIFNKLIERLTVFPTKVIDRLCLTISVFMIVGISSYWENCVEDIISFAKISNEKCVLSLIILENLAKEQQDLHLSEIDRLKIKGHFSEKIYLIDNFINQILSSDLSNENIKHMKDILLEKSFKLTMSMSLFGLNILKDSNLSSNILKYFDENNIELISNIFSESCVRSNMSKIYMYHEKYCIEEILEIFDKDVLISIDSIIRMISRDTIKYLSSNENTGENMVIKHFKIVSKLGNILSDVLENFIFVLFMKNETSNIALQLLSFYIIIKNRKISRLFFETISEMRDFINKGYLLGNFSDSEKLEFCEYLIQISEGVMANSKLESLSLSNLKNIKTIDDINQEEVNINEFDISCSDYRGVSEDVFYNIFLIFCNNFGNDGVKYFFSKFSCILEKANINSEEVLKNEQILIIVEVVMFAVKSLFDALIAVRFDDIITNFINIFLKSNVLRNDRLLHSFLVFLDQGSQFVAVNDESVELSIKLLANLIRMKKLDIICCDVLLNITDYLTKPYVNYYLLCFPLFEERFDNLNKDSLVYFANALCNLIAFKDKKNKKSALGTPIEDVIKYNSMLLNVSISKIIQNHDSFIAKKVVLNNENQKLIKESFINCYAVVNIILKEACYLQKNIFNELCFIFLDKSFTITEMIFEIYHSDSSFITELSCIFTKIITHLEEKSLNYFDQLNNLMLKCFSNNSDNYECLNVLCNLYRIAGMFHSDKVSLIAQNFSCITEIIHRNLALTKTRQIEIVQSFANLFTVILEMVNFIVLDKDKLYKDINLFCEAISNIAEPNMNKVVIKFFNRFINSTKIFPIEIIMNLAENIIFICIKSCSHFEIGISLELARLIISAYRLNPDQCVNTVRKSLDDAQFKKINKDDVNIICKFLVKFVDRESEIKEMVLNIINAGKNMDFADFANLLLKINISDKYGQLEKEIIEIN